MAEEGVHLTGIMDNARRALAGLYSKTSDGGNGNWEMTKDDVAAWVNGEPDGPLEYLEGAELAENLPIGGVPSVGRSKNWRITALGIDRMEKFLHLGGVAEKQGRVEYPLDWFA